MSNFSMSERILAEKTVCILLVRGESPDGQEIYAYVAVRADKMEEFMRAQSEGDFSPEDFGVIIESGTGDPSDEVRTRMEQDYGFNHQYMIDVPDEEEAMSLTKDVLGAVAAGPPSEEG